MNIWKFDLSLSDRYDGNVNIDSPDARPGIVHYFVKQTINVNDRHPCKYHPCHFDCGLSGISPEVWCANLFDCFGVSLFVPVQRISGKFLPG